MIGPKPGQRGPVHGECNGCLWLQSLKYGVCTLPKRTACPYYAKLAKKKQKKKGGE